MNNSASTANNYSLNQFDILESVFTYVNINMRNSWLIAKLELCSGKIQNIWQSLSLVLAGGRRLFGPLLIEEDLKLRKLRW